MARPKSPPKNMEYLHGNERHEIVYVDYVNRKPFNVLTLEHLDGRHQETVTCTNWWDFEWSKRDGALYYHLSGCGFELEITLYQLVKPSSPPTSEFWLADGIPLMRELGHGKSLSKRPIRDSELARMGYVRLQRPRMICHIHGQRSRNPFDVSDEGETVYCRWCDDRILDDCYSEVCEHLTYCEQGCGWIHAETKELADDSSSKCECKEEEDDG